MFIAIAIHVIAAIIWIGGMFFAYVCLRPVAAALLPPPQRLPLWVQTFERFFPYVWAAVVALPTTGIGLAVVMFGGPAGWPIYVHVMFGLGLAMIAIFLHVYFAPFQRLRRAVSQSDFASGGEQLGQIRRLVGYNLLLGVLVALVASGGRLYQ